MAFVLQDISNKLEESNSLHPLKKLKKENLVKVAAHYGITLAVAATKSHILNLIEYYCIKISIIDEVEEKQTAEVLKLKLEIEHEERRLAREEAQSSQCRQSITGCTAEVEAQRACDLRLAELREAREIQLNMN